MHLPHSYFSERSIIILCLEYIFDNGRTKIFRKVIVIYYILKDPLNRYINLKIFFMNLIIFYCTIRMVRKKDLGRENILYNK